MPISHLAGLLMLADVLLYYIMYLLYPETFSPIKNKHRKLQNLLRAAQCTNFTAIPFVFQLFFFFFWPYDKPVFSSLGFLAVKLYTSQSFLLE